MHAGWVGTHGRPPGCWMMGSMHGMGHGMGHLVSARPCISPMNGRDGSMLKMQIVVLLACQEETGRMARSKKWRGNMAQHYRHEPTCQRQSSPRAVVVTGARDSPLALLHVSKNGFQGNTTG
jgi:hypothetical protein